MSWEDFNKIEKTVNENYAGYEGFLLRFLICFSQNPSYEGVESTS